MINYDPETNTVTVKPKGELDSNLAEKIRNPIDAEILKNNASKLVIDMRDIAFMDSSGIGLLIGRYKLMKRMNGKISVFGMCDQVMRIFRMSGLCQIISHKEGA